MKKFRLSYVIEKGIALEAQNEDDACERFWNLPEGKEADRIEEVEELKE
ncbi:MAG: hypothetical protein AABX17_03890 [Nanoarchaeota archaeon]